MKLLVVILGLVAAVAARQVDSPPIFKDYHEEFGIPRAREARLMEESVDFDGSRIIGGQPAPLGAQPHLGGLIITLTDDRTSICGSSLLSSTRAVTAAHCWSHGNNQARQFLVVLGSMFLFSGGTRVTTSNVVPHPQYNAQNLNNDIAVIQLPPVSFTDHIRPVRLPTSQGQFVNIWVLAAGFGATGPNVPISLMIPKHEVSVQVISNDVCQQTYGPSVVVPAVLCVGTTGPQGAHGPCPGDNGGSLLIGPATDRVLIGVTSFFHTAGCAAGHPVGFARVTNFAAWINTFL